MCGTTAEVPRRVLRVAVLRLAGLRGSCLDWYEGTVCREAHVLSDEVTRKEFLHSQHMDAPAESTKRFPQPSTIKNPSHVTDNLD